MVSSWGSRMNVQRLGRLPLRRRIGAELAFTYQMEGFGKRLALASPSALVNGGMRCGA